MRPTLIRFSMLFSLVVLPLLMSSCSDDDCAVCPPPPAPVGWVEQSTPATADLSIVHAFDRQTAIAAGGAGIVVRTENGGAAWNLVSSGTTEVIKDMFFLDDSRGWIVGENGTALASTDGGLSWSPLTVPVTQHLREVVFVSAEVGFIGGGPTGGQTGDPVLLRTVDGGATWTAGAFPFTIRNMFFADADHGWAGGGDRLERTTDGGATWEPSPHGHTGWLGCIFFVDTLHGWVSGGAGFIAHSADGGITWETQNGGTTRNLVRVFALDRTTAWYVARSPGVVAGTRDGGATWSFQTLPDGAIPAGVVFADAEVGWITCREGRILKTVTGGW
jgi:photosystem II stability/assembly factor-like uncharacterized protein